MGQTLKNFLLFRQAKGGLQFRIAKTFRGGTSPEGKTLDDLIVEVAEKRYEMMILQVAHSIPARFSV